MVEMYRAIWMHTRERQVLLIVLSLVLASLAAAPLELQKDIINHIVSDESVPVLVWLSLGFLAVTAVSAGLKMAVQYLSSSLGEDVIRQIRQEISKLLVKGHDDPERQPKTGTAVTMISAEAEQIGVFAGDAITLPLLQLGTLLTVVIYISAQSVILGLITACVVLPQGLLTLLTQRRINGLVRQRIAALRAGTDRLAASDLAVFDAETSACFDRIYEARCGIFRIKLTTKFAMNLLNAMGMSAILLIGGTYVIQGLTDVGTITVALTALTRAVQPWRELLMFFRRAAMVRVRFEVLRDTFPGSFPPARA
ncbi:MAG: ABC transporter transmembrane domain-containing protein [Pseudomonadota bacterium]